MHGVSRLSVRAALVPAVYVDQGNGPEYFGLYSTRRLCGLRSI